MFMMRGWLVLLVLALAGCQGPATPRSGQPSDGVKDTSALAAEALERGEYAKAAELYRVALATMPDSLPLHYGLGVSASFTDRKREAVRELTWVLEHGEAGSSEVTAARRWLRSVGALPRSGSELTTVAQEQQPAPESHATHASVHGRVTDGERTSEAAPKSRMQLLLMEHPSRENYYRIRTDEHGYFRFQNVAPGIYKLTERVAGPPVWRLRVELKPGEDLSLDLNPANSTKVRDDFPDSAAAPGPRS
jgi:hypothetical protein